MELWIRTQDKDILLKIDSLLIDDNNNDIYTQCWVGVNLETYTLGKYKSKERALEVLDEIQQALLLNDKYDFTQPPVVSSLTCNLIYEMPEE